MLDDLLSALGDAPTGSSVLSDRVMYSEGFIRSPLTGEWAHKDGRVKSEHFDPTRHTYAIQELIEEAGCSWVHNYDAPNDKVVATVECHDLEVGAFHVSTALSLCLAFRQTRLFD